MLFVCYFIMLVTGCWLVKHSKITEVRMVIALAMVVATLLGILVISGMLVAINQHDSYEELKATAIEKIETNEAGIALIKEKLQDDPALMDKLIGYLENENEAEKKEINRLTKLLEDVELKNYKRLVWPLGR